MSIQKLLAAVGLAGALLLGVAAPAEARGWGGGGFHRGPGYGGGFHRGPMHHGPVYRPDNWRRAEIERRLEWERAQQWRHERHPYGNRY